MKIKKIFIALSAMLVLTISAAAYRIATAKPDKQVVLICPHHAGGCVVPFNFRGWPNIP